VSLPARSRAEAGTVTIGETGCVQGEGTTSDRSDPDAVVAQLFDEHARSLVTLARLFVDYRDAAEDIVQEAFIRMARSLDRLEDPAKAAAYLRSIVLNLARDHNRRGLMSMRHSQQANDLDLAGVDEEIVDRDDYQRLLLSLRALPRRQRDCVALHHMFELSVPEIAETLGVSPNSVKTHLRRGMGTLRSDPGVRSYLEEQA
jgi:RNA polymerase sigma factor (sigma-70 family)